MVVVFWKTDVVSSPLSRRRTKTSRHGSAPSFSSSIVNYISVNIEFRWTLKGLANETSSVEAEDLGIQDELLGCGTIGNQ